MVDRHIVEQQLKRIGCNFQLWGRSEVSELGNVLMDGETLAHCVNGHYKSGFAMLCATDHRVLLVDKKPMGYLHVEDLRFELISEFDYSHRALNATVHICTTTKTMVFTSWNRASLRNLLSYVQQRVIEIRQYYYLAQQFQAAQHLQTYPATQIPSLALQSPLGGQVWQRAQLPEPATRLGIHTYSKLPHLRRRGSKHLGEYAVATPDEIYPPQEIAS